MSDQSQTPVVRIAPSQGAGVLDFAEVWRYRGLLWRMTLRQLQTRFGMSRINVVWGFMRPGVMTLAFAYLRHVSGANFSQGIPYLLFVFSGFCLWFVFSDCVLSVSSSLRSDATLIQRVYYPRLISPLSVCLAKVIDLVIVMVAIVIVQTMMGVGIDWRIVLSPFAGLTMLVLAFGFGAIFATLTLFYPDTRRVLEIILYLGLFLSPVVFSPDILPPAVQEWYVLNPAVGMLGAIRSTLFSTMEMNLGAWAYAAGFGLALTVVGLWMLSRAARVVAENL